MGGGGPLEAFVSTGEGVGKSNKSMLVWRGSCFCWFLVPVLAVAVACAHALCTFLLLLLLSCLVQVCQGGLQHEFLPIGCDGIWDTLSYEEAERGVWRRSRSLVGLLAP